MASKQKTLFDVYSRLVRESPDIIVSVNRVGYKPSWIGRAKFMLSSFSFQGLNSEVVAVENGESSVKITLP